MEENKKKEIKNKKFYNLSIKAETEIFYEKNYAKLIKNYDEADTKKLHLSFKKLIKKNDKVLDIGFGSGRDLKYIQTLGAECYGVENCKGFLKNFKKELGFQNKLFYGKIPNLKLPINIKFDIITLIAVIMHLNLIKIEKSIKNLKKILKNNGIIIVSYSLGKRKNDERFFENLDEKIIDEIFLRNGFIKLESIKNNDGMKRKIDWITGIYIIG